MFFFGKTLDIVFCNKIAHRIWIAGKNDEKIVITPKM